MQQSLHEPQVEHKLRALKKVFFGKNKIPNQTAK